MKSLPDKGQKRCASCGSFRRLSLCPAHLPNEAHLFCAGCVQRLEQGERLYLVFTSEFEPPGLPEEGFWWLFKAARALISEGVSDEDQIIPTLVFAHEIDRGTAGGPAAGLHGNDPPLMPHVWNTVKRVDGIDILEEEPVQADILVKRPPTTPSAEAVPQAVLIQVSFHKDTVGAERVARVYREKLAARGIRFGGHHSGTIDYEFVGNRLYLTVGLKEGQPVDGAAFPPPRLVGHFYHAVLEEFGGRLTTHGTFKAKNLIPASVAFLLRASGGISGRKEIHRLLNDHVYAGGVFVEDGYATPKVVQLWRDVPKAGIRIAHSLPLFWGRPFSKHFSGP